MAMMATGEASAAVGDWRRGGRYASSIFPMQFVHHSIFLFLDGLPPLLLCLPSTSRRHRPLLPPLYSFSAWISAWKLDPGCLGVGAGT
ncbi:hypothetical protein PIB30_086560 [Stylosanthes scabra]|uniref:Uncharacterized protein n=1 Tax=Stylosanthes scabra TaxID=79078 RepID=A0ABU6VV42_9FABA|nr:hypothetical protein [Stylosanthes scabra]